MVHISQHLGCVMDMFRECHIPLPDSPTCHYTQHELYCTERVVGLM